MRSQQRCRGVMKAELSGSREHPNFVNGIHVLFWEVDNIIELVIVNLRNLMQV